MPNDLEYHYFESWPQTPPEVDVLADVPTVEAVEINGETIDTIKNAIVTVGIAGDFWTVCGGGEDE